METTNPKANSYVKNSHEGYFNVNKFWSSVQAIFGHWINYPNQNARRILLKSRKITKQSIVGDTVLCQLYCASNSWFNNKKLMYSSYTSVLPNASSSLKHKPQSTSKTEYTKKCYHSFKRLEPDSIFCIGMITPRGFVLEKKTN